MTNDEINKYIHEQIMGKCWHEFGGAKRCPKCSIHRFVADKPYCPRYCSDGSPRSLLNAVVEIVRKPDALPLFDALHDNGFSGTMINALLATAEQIARACVAAHQEAK